MSFLLTLCSEARADLSVDWYYLQGRAVGRDGHPLANEEVYLRWATLAGTFFGRPVRRFKTDSAGYFKVQVFYFVPCMSGVPMHIDSVTLHATQTDGRLYLPKLREAAALNGDSLLLQCGSFTTTILSPWQKHYSAMDDSTRLLPENTNLLFEAKAFRDTLALQWHAEVRQVYTFMKEKCTPPLEKAYTLDWTVDCFLMMIDLRNRSLTEAQEFFDALPCPVLTGVRRGAVGNEWELESPRKHMREDYYFLCSKDGRILEFLERPYR